MLTVEDIEKTAEVPKKKKQQFGKLFQIHPHERLEKKTALKDLGRNSKCVCGSGKKFKKCCISKMRFENTYDLKDNYKDTHVIKNVGNDEIELNDEGMLKHVIINTKEAKKNKAKQNKKIEKQRHKTIG